VPDQLEALEALFLYFLNDDQPAKALKAGKRLLDKYPDHVPSLEAYGRLCVKRGDYQEGLTALQAALKANPLDRKLRATVGTTRMLVARAAVEKKNIEAARPEYQAALSLLPAEEAPSVLCRWAAAELKAGDAARAEELLQQAAAHGTPLADAYVMLTETVRLKLPRPLKARFEAVFQAELEKAPVAKDVVPLVNYLAGLTKLEKPYTGAKGHQTKILKYVDRARTAPFTAGQIEALCQALLQSQAWKRVTAFAKRGQRDFPNDPVFPYLEAMSYGGAGEYGRDRWKATELLEKADRLAAAQPREARREELQEEIKRQLALLAATDPLGMLDNLFGGRVPDPFSDDEYDDDDGQW
jgi:hypothetical protein